MGCTRCRTIGHFLLDPPVTARVALIATGSFMPDPKLSNEEWIRPGDRTTVCEGVRVLSGQSTGPRLLRFFPFLGPAFIASIAYMDPGNFATNIQAGAQFGYLLLWVVLASNLMAMLVQSLSAKLGIASGLSLPEMIPQEFPRPLTWALWLLAKSSPWPPTSRSSWVRPSGSICCSGSRSSQPRS